MSDETLRVSVHTLSGERSMQRVLCKHLLDIVRAICVVGLTAFFACEMAVERFSEHVVEEAPEFTLAIELGHARRSSQSDGPEHPGESVETMDLDDELSHHLFVMWKMPEEP